MARNVDNLNTVAEVCKTAGSAEVIILSKDLSISEECISAVEDTVAHLKGKYKITHQEALSFSLRRLILRF